MKSVIRVQRKEVDQVRDMISHSSSSNAGVNYQRKNYQEIVERQATIKKQRIAESQARESPFKLSRFAKVGALVYKKPEEIKELRDGRKSHLSAMATRPGDNLQLVMELSPGPKNYVTTNAQEVISSPPKQLPAKVKVSAKSLNPSYGRVPKYLQKYNAVAYEEMQRRNAAEASKCPPGMRLLPEEERQRTYDLLVQQRQETILALNKVPLGASAPSVLKYKTELERKLEDLEKTILVFARPKVFVET